MKWNLAIVIPKSTKVTHYNNAMTQVICFVQALAQSIGLFVIISLQIHHHLFIVFGSMMIPNTPLIRLVCFLIAILMLVFTNLLLELVCLMKITKQ